MIYESIVATRIAGKFRALVVVLAALSMWGAGQQVFAQSADECLACHTGLPAAANNVIGEEVDAQITSAACDYSSADLFGGWGWNPVSRTSCPPLADDEDAHAGFPVCSATFYDADGDGFGWENQASCIITSASKAPPSFTNRETGKAVELVRAYWNGNADIADKLIQCDLYYYDSYLEQYQVEATPFRSGAGFNNQVFPSYRFHHLKLPLTAPHTGLIKEVAYVDGADITVTAFGTAPDWTTDDGRYIGPTVLQSPYVELVTRTNGSRAIRTWHPSRFDTALNLQLSGNRTRSDGFFECWNTSGGNLVPTGRFGGLANDPATDGNTEASQCDYSNADQFDGWGWNPVTRQSCSPLEEVTSATPAGDCDYSNAAVTDGWGWNATTGQSCPPLSGSDVQGEANSAQQGCDYSDAASNGGWGWNSATGRSCAPQ